MEEFYDNELGRLPLKPFVYPPIITRSFLVVFIALGCTAYIAQPYIKAAQYCKIADKAAADGEALDAVNGYLAALRECGSSRQIKLKLAENVFKLKEFHHELAFFYLQGITLNNNEWDRLCKVMPAEYKEHFYQERE